MSDAVSAEVRGQRPNGSDLLLQKIPLYARAKSFADSSLDDPNSESQTLSYDGGVYRVLSLLKAAEVEREREETSGTHGESYHQPLVASGVEGPFCGITTLLSSSSIRRQRWRHDDNAADGERNAISASLRQRMVRGQRELELVEGAVALPLQRELLRPTVGGVEVRLLLGMASDREAAAEAEAERQRQRRLRRAGVEKRITTTANSDAEDVNGQDSADSGDDTAVALGKRHLSRLRRGLAVDVKRRGYGTNMALFSTAPAGEQSMVVAVRTAAAENDADGINRAEPGGISSKATTLAVGPGARMTNVLLRHLSSTAPADVELHDVKAVKAYLKRVAWLEKQNNAAQASATTLAGTGTSWTQLSAAERVRREMEHTTRERQRYSRKRTRDEGGDGDGDESGR